MAKFTDSLAKCYGIVFFLASGTIACASFALVQYHKDLQDSIQAVRNAKPLNSMRTKYTGDSLKCVESEFDRVRHSARVSHFSDLCDLMDISDIADHGRST
jgi:hypothetical protein